MRTPLVLDTLLHIKALFAASPMLFVIQRNEVLIKTLLALNVVSRQKTLSTVSWTSNPFMIEHRSPHTKQLAFSTPSLPGFTGFIPLATCSIPKLHARQCSSNQRRQVKFQARMLSVLNSRRTPAHSKVRTASPTTLILHM